MLAKTGIVRMPAKAPMLPKDLYNVLSIGNEVMSLLMVDFNSTEQQKTNYPCQQVRDISHFRGDGQ